MIAIHFEEHATCSRLLHKLRTYINRYAAYGLGATVTKCADRNIIEVEYGRDEFYFFESFQPLLVSILIEEVIETKEDEWLMDIAETVFCFTDAEEKRQIAAIAHAILHGERPDIPIIHAHSRRRNYLYEAFSTYIDPHTSFYYEAFLTFRLKKYGDVLVDVVGKAIDEYLLEQEYQTMVEGCRQYLKQTAPKRKLIYVVQDQQTKLYNEHWARLTNAAVPEELEKICMFEKDVDKDKRLISPLVSRVPAHVHIFSDEPDHAIVLTIQAIFQERLTITPLTTCVEKVKK
ncbi:putative sporulation protein YtxC [Shouchella lonarensis]|uniref:Putative sporulation protein YtxC n=1 Tax=Shouchella lonarensis TaxID=1464122 RepID=A0A1G6GRB4_9BACI|nr:putative sporulation protein YtxC [Shouchella lonarensis]SDB83736.1 putative sporulation protein YtxC [Shouchella lonarensis]